MTAHTLDDQAETVLFRLARGSGLSGLGGMERVAPLPFHGAREMLLLRPFLHLPKPRLIATLKARGLAYSEDASNADPRFARVRLRAIMPVLAREGLDARGLARLAERLRRAEATVEFAVAAAGSALASKPWPKGGPVVFSLSDSQICRPKWGFACSAVPSLMPATRGRSSLASSIALRRAARSPRRACGARSPAP